MLNPLNLISKFIKSNNQKELDRIAKIVTKINSLENRMSLFSLHRDTLESNTTAIKIKSFRMLEYNVKIFIL